MSALGMYYCTLQIYYLTHRLTQQRICVSSLMRLMHIFLFTTATWQLQHNCCKPWRLPFIIINKYDDVTLPYSQRGTGRKEKRRLNNPVPLLLSVFSLSVKYLKRSVTLVWGWSFSPFFNTWGFFLNGFWGKIMVNKSSNSFQVYFFPRTVHVSG